MSSIEKMLIQGVRSFGPDDRDKQVIEFFTPLTLILGPNGTGKTTIIECLKYITTGDLPPGATKNAAFIHDPKIANETEVKAQVRLLFRDVRSQRCITTRSMVATQKAKKVEMKTLEGLITRKDAAGNDQSISSKCAEINSEMVTLLGVAKPILDSVIFCHQEDSNWPLSEGKALKNRFDDIFASTRYVKALDNIRKLRAEQTHDIKNFHTEIKYLKQNRDKAQQLQEEKESFETKYMASKETVEKINEKIEPITDKLDQLKTKGQEIFKLQTKIEKMKTESSQIKKSQQELRKNIKKEFKGSTAELKKTIQDFEGQVQEQEDILHQYETTVEKLSRKLNEISEEKSVLLAQQGALQHEAERHEKNIKTRDAMIENLAEQYHVTGYLPPLSDKKIKEFLKILDTKEKDMDAELRAKRMTHEEEESVVQVEIDELRNTRTKVETELAMKVDSLTKNRKQIREIKQELSRVDASAEHLKDIQRDLKRVETELGEAEKSVDLDSLKTEVATLQKSKVSLDSRLKTLDTEMSRLSLESTARTQLDIFKKERTSKMDAARKLKSKTEDHMKHLLGHMPTENLGRALHQSTSKLSGQVRSTNVRLQKLRSELTQKETQFKMEREQLAKKEQEFRGYEVRLNNVSGSQNFDEGLEKLQSDLKKYQDEKGHLNGVDYLYKKYQVTLREDDPPCPLCHRPFDNATEVDELVDELEKKLDLIPERLDRCTVKVDRNKNKVEEMIQLKPVRSAMVDLEKDDIPKLKQKTVTLDEQIKKLKEDIGDVEEEVDSLSVDEGTAQSIQTDVAMIDKIQNELKDLDRKIATQSSKLSGGDDDRNMQDVQADREEVQEELETVNRNIDRKRQKITEQSDHLQQLKSSLNELKGEKLQIESDLQKRTRLEANKVSLESDNDTLEREIKDNKGEMRPLQDSIKEKEKEKQKLAQIKEKHYEAGMKQLNVVKEEHRKVKSHNTDVETYLRKGKDQQLEQNAKDMDMVESRASKLSKEKDEISSQINQMKDDLATQKMRERELQDNLSVRNKEVEVVELTNKTEELEVQLGGLDVNNLNREVRDMERQRDKLIAEKHQADGRQRGLEDQIRRLAKELKDDMYREAEVKYRDKMIHLRTTEMANQDLEKYYKAMDRTIMSYHSMKMTEINKIIRELWRNTYKGNDIETIEIRSDEEEGSGASKNRRTYNYRVVMIKGDAALDMRNRCSAGQKVLASLIIRLALAETFCLNCGILALDEPTTNLDRENIESLAYALAEIIKSRSRQRNFQLVVITHDEDFVELLGRSDYVEEFFKVRKNEDGCSRLVKAKVEALHSR